MGALDNIILAIDTTGKRCAAALCRRYSVLAEITLSGKKAHGETLAPAVEALFALSGYAPSDVAAVACSAGPGSFTGIRIGAAAAKGLALGLGIPLLPIDTLAALACAASERSETSQVYAPIIDARRGQVYSAFYRFTAEGAYPEVIEAPACRMFVDVLAAAQRFDTVIFTGDGADGRESVITAQKGCYVSDKSIRYQSAAAVAALGFITLESGFAADEFEPFYARLAQAEQDLKDRTEK